MNPLPPQAYTKETLVKAYQWLQQQNAHIKEIATGPDILVSLFLKAKLQGEDALERPSIQNFKMELRNLAGMMGEFEVVERATPSSPLHLPPLRPPPPPASPAVANGATPPQAQDDSVKTSQGQAKMGLVPEIDTRSWLMIQEVKTQLNLSSEHEALRMLISVGHTKVKALLAEK